MPGAVRTFAFARDAPAAARHYTVGTLRDWGGDWGAGDLADDAALVVTELAANAIVHAHSWFTVILAARGDLLRISVRDATPPSGEPLVPVPLHGLGAVDALASRWGVESLGNAGKTVWVELRGGGEAACFAHLVCPECGAVTAEGHRPGCQWRPDE